MSIQTQAAIIGATKQRLFMSWQYPQSGGQNVACNLNSGNQAGALPIVTLPTETLTGTAPTQTMASGGTYVAGSTVANFPPIRNTALTDFMITKAVLTLTALPFAYLGNAVGSIRVYDLLWSACIPLSAVNTITITSFPATNFNLRIPVDNSAAPDYKGLELWFVQDTGAVNTFTMTVTYANEANVSHTTPAITITTITSLLGCMTRIPLAIGDQGLQTVTSVAITSPGTSSTGHLLIMRRVVSQRTRPGNGLTVEEDILTMGAPRINYNAALLAVVIDTGFSGSLDARCMLEIASG